MLLYYTLILASCIQYSQYDTFMLYYEFIISCQSLLLPTPLAYYVMSCPPRVMVALCVFLYKHEADT